MDMEYGYGLWMWIMDMDMNMNGANMLYGKRNMKENGISCYLGLYGL